MIKKHFSITNNKCLLFFSFRTAIEELSEKSLLVISLLALISLTIQDLVLYKRTVKNREESVNGNSN